MGISQHELDPDARECSFCHELIDHNGLCGCDPYGDAPWGFGFVPCGTECAAVDGDHRVCRNLEPRPCTFCAKILDQDGRCAVCDAVPEGTPDADR